MHWLKKRCLVVGVGATVAAGAFLPGPAGAQSVPVVPPIGPAVSACAIAGDLGPCIAGAVPSAPVVVVPGGPFFGSGGRNVTVDKDVDRSRTPGTVVVR